MHAQLDITKVTSFVCVQVYLASEGEDALITERGIVKLEEIIVPSVKSSLLVTSPD